MQGSSFTCPNCSASAQLWIKAPLFICCESCGHTYQIDESGTISPEDIIRRNRLEVETIKLGVTGSYKGAAFRIIGRIRSISGSAITNEWLMHFSDGKFKWLCETAFSYSVFENEGKAMAKDVTSGKPGRWVSFSGKEYMIVDISKQQQFGTEGQIPYEAYNDDKHFTIDCMHPASGDLLTIKVFTAHEVEGFPGVPVVLKDLQLSTLSEFQSWA